MDREKIVTAVDEAKRFIARAEKLLPCEGTHPSWDNPKESGSARRASMELTRALAEMRRPG